MRGTLPFIKYNLKYSADERLSVALWEGFVVLCINHLSLVKLKLLPLHMVSSSYSKYRYQNKLATEVPIVADTSLFTVFIESLFLSVCNK